MVTQSLQGCEPSGWDGGRVYKRDILRFVDEIILPGNGVLGEGPLRPPKDCITNGKPGDIRSNGRDRSRTAYNNSISDNRPQITRGLFVSRGFSAQPIVYFVSFPR